MMRRGFLAAVAVLVVFGCELGPTRVLPLGSGRYEIRTDPGCSNRHRDAVDELDPTARRACPDGFHYVTVYSREGDCGDFAGATAVVVCDPAEEDR